jgi:hypothetical protein
MTLAQLDPHPTSAVTILPISTSLLPRAENLLERRRRWGRENYQRIKASPMRWAQHQLRQRRWRLAHPIHHQVYRQVFDQRHPGRLKEIAQKSVRLHREDKTTYVREYRRRIRQEMFAAYGSVCACCGEHRIEFLSLDHLNNDGWHHRMQFTKNGRYGQSQLILDLRKRGWPKEGLQILCMNCNHAKGRRGNLTHECPHERERQVATQQ